MWLHLVSVYLYVYKVVVSLSEITKLLKSVYFYLVKIAFVSSKSSEYIYVSSLPKNSSSFSIEFTTYYSSYFFFYSFLLFSLVFDEV